MEEKIEILYAGKSEELANRLDTQPGIRLIEQDNLISALCYLHSVKRPDVILCDLQVNGGDGLDFHRKLRNQSGFDHIPFILLSPEFREETMKEALKSGVDDYFVFPGTAPEVIIGRVRFLKEFRSSRYAVNAGQENEIRYRMPATKRLFDISVASLGLVAVMPILLLIMVAIRLESKGKVYYTSVRVGRKPFRFYKLRSMRDGADAELKQLASERNQYATAVKKPEVDFNLPCPRCSNLGNNETCSPLLHIGSNSICEYWYQLQKKEMVGSKGSFVKIQDDPRITKVGKFIRNTSIDELPQLINVIKGDMSIVGNRPLPLYEAEKLTYDLMSKRFLAPAGLTGLWQVMKRGKSGIMSEEERKALDNQYADIFLDGRYSFWYDLKLILKTVPALLQKETV